MKTRHALSGRPLSRIVISLAIALLSTTPAVIRAAEKISAAVQAQIGALIAEKEARTPAQKKMDSQLVYLAKQSRNEVIANGLSAFKPDLTADDQSRVLVDLNATVSAELLDAITQNGGSVVNHFASFNAIRALVPIGIVETLAARADVRSIGPAALAITNVGASLSQGDRTHQADTARTNTGATGSGIKIGVLSDGVNSLAKSKANGDLNASATFLPGQAGSGDEGTAMMEIIQDLVPDAQIIFATAFGGNASFAANILALQAAGCTIIVDDVSYFNESPFQDQVISQAVNTVSAAGVLYFSSAGNSGNKNDGTSGTWEGDFVSGGVVAAPVTGTGNLLDFGGATTFNTVAAGGSSRRVDLFWADADLASSNDYDLFVLDSTGASVLRSSTNVQTGTQSPYETTSTLNVGERIVVVQRTGAANRFLHLDTGRAVLTISTDGRVRGHNGSGAANAFSVSATNVANSPSPNFFVGGATNPVETFTTDGPRRIFFDPAGTPITPGNFSSTGGTLLNKPDITAADGGITGVGGFNPFFGTSAAAPHAAAIAALLKSYNSSLTPAQIRTAMTSTALDIEAPGNDRDSGAGIVMALAAINAVSAPNSVISGTPLLAAFGLVGGPFNPPSATYTVTNSSAVSLNWTAAKTQPWTTLSSAGGSLLPGASTTVTCSINAAANALALGSYSDLVTITDTTSGFSRTFDVTLNVVSEPPAQVADITGNAGTSGNIVIGGSNYHVYEGIYLEAEIGAANFTSAGTAINQIAFSCSTVGTTPTVASPNYNIYLQNVPSGTTTLATGAYSTAGYTLVYSGPFSYPATGFQGVTLTTPFVRTAGSNVQVLIERTDNVVHSGNIWNAAMGNLAAGSGALTSRRYNSTVAPVSGTTSLSASNFRAAIRFKHSAANNAGVNLVYSLGEVPAGLAAQTVKALISNTGANALTNLPVTLNVTGANTFTDTQIIPSLASGAQATVTFAAFTPGVVGSCTVQVSVPADGEASDNSLTKPLSVTPLTYSYKYPGSTATGGVGVNGNTAALVGKFTTTAANAITDVKLEFAAITATTYRVAIYGDSGSNTPSTAALYVDAADRTVSVAGPVTITLPAPVAVGPGNFYVGIQQTNTTNASLSYDAEAPIRSGSFFLDIPNPPASWGDFSPGANFKLNIGAILQTPAAVPEIAVEQPAGPANDIPDGGSKNFGSVDVGSSTSLVFTIKNIGTGNLTGLTFNPNTGSNPGDFSVTANPTAPVSGPAGSTTFTVQFTPGAPGPRSAVIHIASNDSDENPFEINVFGTGTSPPVTQLGAPASVFANTGTLGFTVPAGTNRLLVVTASGVKATDVTSVSFGSTPLTQAVEATDTFAVDSIWVLPMGTSASPVADIITMTTNSVASPNERYISAVVFSGVNQTTPTSSPQSAFASTTTMSLNVTSAPGDLVYDVMDAYDGALLPSITLNSGQTLVTEKTTTVAVLAPGYPSGGFQRNVNSSKPGAASVAMNWTSSPSGALIHAAINIKMAGSLALPAPAPVASALGDVISGAGAPDGGGADSGLDFDMLTRGGYIAENGNLAFPGELTGPGVDGSNFKGFWKRTGATLARLARTGDNAPETGATAAKFSDLPLIPGINDDGQVTLFASLATNPLSTPPTTLDNDTGLWSELGGTGFQILMREDDAIPAQVPPLPAGTKLGAFSSGCFATANTSASTGEAVFTATLRGGTTDSVLIRASINGPTVTAVGVVARENQAAPGVAGQTFGFLNSSYTEAVRMDALGNIVFGSFLKPSIKTSLWYQSVAGGAPVKAFVAGEAAPNAAGATPVGSPTFAALDVPSMGGGGTFAFRGVLNLDGDNVANDKNDGIWRGSIAGGFSNILRRGDNNTNRPGLFAGPILVSNPNIKAGNIWSGWLTNSNHGAWLGWVDLAGDGISAYPADTFGIYTDLGSEGMNLLISSGDPAPGIAGATLFFVDHPVVSGTAPSEYLAFIATVTGGGTTASDNKGLWRSLNGAAPTLVLRTGDAMTTTQGAKTIADIDLPGSNYYDHIWETPVMDKDGRILAYITFTDGSTSQVIVP